MQNSQLFSVYGATYYVSELVFMKKYEHNFKECDDYASRWHYFYFSDYTIYNKKKVGYFFLQKRDIESRSGTRKWSIFLIFSRSMINIFNLV